MPNFFGGQTASDSTWLAALPVPTHPIPGRYYTQADGIWVSVGASYGAQVEFSSSRAADSFIAQHPGITRAAQGTNRPRVVCDTKDVFVAAWCAAAGRPLVVRRGAPVHETPVPPPAPVAVAPPAAPMEAPRPAESKALMDLIAAGWSRDDVSMFKGHYSPSELLEMHGRGFSAVDLREILGI